MAKEKKVEQITDMEVDFAQWYTDVCKKAELIDYSSIKGMFIYRPYGYAIWENIQRLMDAEFKKTGAENVYMPMLIPESLLQKEKDHVEGFAPECAWVTMGGSEKLEERYCIRPTSETLFCEHFHDIIHSWRDLPKMYNQWCSVLRWEKTSRPFLRHREFLWQEGHTMHATAEEAREETERMLNVYADFCENVLAMPVTRGQKTDKEKFNGAEATYTIECMMHDRKALQAGTSHFFGDGFAKAFDIFYTDKNNQKVNPFQTSWGVSTRLIGGIIMTHGDNSGLVLPPKIAPVQIVIIPIAMHKEGVLEKARAVAETLRAAGLRVKLDESELCFSNTIRSSVTAQKWWIVNKISAIAALAGGSTVTDGSYPGWAFNPNSEVKETILAAYEKLFGKKAGVEAIHAGLECGLFADSIPGLDCVAIGPDMHDVHTPRERLSISSTRRTYELLRLVLAESK